MAMPTESLDMEVQLAPESVNIAEVVVAVAEPTRTALGATTVSHLSASTIAREVPSNAATLLWNSGQVMVQQSQQGGGSPILRGFEANRILAGGRRGPAQQRHLPEWSPAKRAHRGSPSHSVD